jgi:uncharacterized protein
MQIRILSFLPKVNKEKNMYSKTYGKVSINKMINIIKDYINSDKTINYKVTIGTDSQNRNVTKIVIVVAIHRIGKGGIFFYDIKTEKKIKNLQQKIYYETALSLELGSKLAESFLDEGIEEDIEIHADIGKRGKTSSLITEIVGWIRSSGFECKIKPEAYAAACIADRISK